MKGVDKEERMQRIRLGLTGLAFVFLFVLLGAAIIRSSEDPLAPTTLNEPAAPEEPNEPLAEIGAAPGTPAANEASAQESAPSKAQ